MGYKIRYKYVGKAASIVDKDAYRDYRLTSKIRDPKKFKDFSTYRATARSIWKKVYEKSIEHESGVYAKGFFYLVPQVTANNPYTYLPNGTISSNSHTDGNLYGPIFCNIIPEFNYFCWSIDGSFTQLYTDKLHRVINKYIPRYYFMLTTLLKNKL